MWSDVAGSVIDITDALALVNLYCSDVLSSLLTPEASTNATLRVSSVDAKPSELVEAVKVVEKKDIKLQSVSLDEFRKEEAKAWEQTPATATVFTLTRIWYEGGSDFTKKPRALYYRDGKEVEDKTLESQLFKDVPKEDVATVLGQIL